MKKSLFFALATVALACSSCGNRNGLYAVSGKVTYRGEPATGAKVFLQRPGVASLQDHALMGVVQQDGSFTIFCDGLGGGAPPGEYIVLIEWKYNPALPVARSPQESGTRPDRLEGRYADPHRPLLQATVKAETNRLPAFELN